MKKVLLAAAILVGISLIVGSSGNFRAYTSSRSTILEVVSGENSYVGFTCPTKPVELKNGGEIEFTLISVGNLMNVPIAVHTKADFSGLPEGVNGTVDEPNTILQPGERTSFRASVKVSNFTDGGLYEIPVTIYATWDGGSARIEACSAVLNVSADPLVIEKHLAFGNWTFPVNTHQRWVMEVRFKNNGDAEDFTVIDFVNPLLFKIVGVTVSKGTPTWRAGLVTWDVHLGRGETTTMTITVENLCWYHHCSTSCAGNYVLNRGACVIKTGDGHCSCCPAHHHNHHTCCLVSSNGITVTATGSD